MTNFDVIISKGPSFLAHILAESKIRSMEAICEKLDVPFKVSDKMRAELYLEHEEYLKGEAKESTNGEG